MERQQLMDSIKHLMEEPRFKHTLGVEDVACDLALIHGCDINKACIAGILHDCAKGLSDEELIRECNRYDLPITDAERQKKLLLHAKVGAAYAEDKFGITDEDILNAIRYHTTGRAGMTLLEKIIFIADYIEPNREPLPRIDRIRWEAYNHLDTAVTMISENMLLYLRDIGSVIDIRTIETYEYYKDLTTSKGTN